jgi:hypothetical protein
MWTGLNYPFYYPRLQEPESRGRDQRPLPADADTE